MNQLVDTMRRMLEDPSRNAPALAAAVSIVVIFFLVIVLVLIAFALPNTSPRVRASSRLAARLKIPRWLSLAIIAALTVSAVAGSAALWYHGTSSDDYCTKTCHAMAIPTETWMLSAHADVSCVRCHEGRPWRSFGRGVGMRLNSLYLELTGAPPRGDQVPPDNCMSCHLNVIEKPLEARNGEMFLHGEVLTLDPGCTRCHGPQGHEPPRP